ncbi:hypothetical protein SRB17_04880 [Streptomyces sp. RB17]|uniref:hypothetical protein n=1 Tax=Streptomyces sp. RB17 TaxID=2585197 RepID=UPI0012962707|nr:hypothetical protein [Streptomyces sp. RB17]MQY32537.1 hypothetical protein [Streptomyces sp. RB17]
MSSYYDYRPQGPERAPAAGEQAEPADRLSDVLLTGRSPQQEEIADRIYQELKAGAQVDDIKHLIGQLSRTATEDARRRAVGRGGGGRR